jgi:hypothetical protein
MERCKDGIEALRQYRADFDEKTRAFKDTPKHDWTSHTADAFRYLCMAWREQVKPVEKPDVPDVKAITDYKVEEMWKFNKRPREGRPRDLVVHCSGKRTRFTHRRAALSFLRSEKNEDILRVHESECAPRG